MTLALTLAILVSVPIFFAGIYVSTQPATKLPARITASVLSLACLVMTGVAIVRLVIPEFFTKK